MHAKQLTLGGLVIAVSYSLVAFSLHAAETKPPTTTEQPAIVSSLQIQVAKLQKKVITLDAEVTRLKTNVASLEKENAQLRQMLRTPLDWARPLTTRPAPSLQAPTDIPRDAIRREFNGDYYYLIPVNSSAKAH